MPSLNRISLTAIMTLLLVAPYVGASAAHPHPHNYVGTAVNNVFLKVNEEGNKVKVNLESAVVGVCADVSPVLARLFPPEPIRDGDTDVGVGGGCFAFETVYGSDTGATLAVTVQPMAGFIRPVWITCVDVSGDGVCEGKTEPYNLCTTGPAGSFSMIDGGACTIYADPAATLNPAVFVLMIGGLEADGETISPLLSTSGFILLN